LDLGLDPAAADQLLSDSPLTGHDRRPVIEVERLDDLLVLLERSN
jgi:hypothetical protein